MYYGNVSAINTIIVIFCFGYIQNKTRSKISVLDDISDPNSEIYLDSLQLLMKYGYKPQAHSVTTMDGYILNLYRISNKGPPVLLVHGIGDSSDSWIVAGPSSSMAYQLADLGYDVWLFNSRGNKYSKRHVKNLSKKQYWDFSYEEMGTQDMPAVIDYILSLTSQKKLNYIGFSQGTTVFFIMCSLKPGYNDKINQAILLAPIGWINDIEYPFIDIIAQKADFLKTIFDSINVYDIFDNNDLLRFYHAKVCRDGVPENILCKLEYYISYGIRNISNLYLEKLPVIASHIPAGVSTKTLVHFLQTYRSRRFQRYDYGPEQNRIVYSSATPPQYDLSSVTAPVNLYVSGSDRFSTVSNVEILKQKLPNILRHVVINSSLDFTHLEFVYGARAKPFINDHVTNILLASVYS